MDTPLTWQEVRQKFLTAKYCPDFSFLAGVFLHKKFDISPEITDDQIFSIREVHKLLEEFVVKYRENIINPSKVLESD